MFLFLLFSVFYSPFPPHSRMEALWLHPLGGFRCEVHFEGVVCPVFFELQRTPAPSEAYESADEPGEEEEEEFLDQTEGEVTSWWESLTVGTDELLKQASSSFLAMGLTLPSFSISSLAAARHSLTRTLASPVPATAAGAEGSSLPTSPVAAVPRHPVVLCHGLFGFDMLGFRQLPLLHMNYWGTIPSSLEELGIRAFVTRVPPSADVKDRAQALFEQLALGFPDCELNLVGHSMGGLDCRYLTSVILPGLEPAKRPFSVKSITTLVTPHRGSPFAEWIIRKLGIDAGLEKTLQRVGLNISALSCLTPDYCQNVFNKTVEDRPEVLYFSYGAAASRRLVRRTPLEFSFHIIESAEGPNDGLVSVESSKWGNYQETLVGDHLDLIGVKPKFLMRDAAQGDLGLATFRKIVNTLVENGC